MNELDELKERIRALEERLRTGENKLLHVYPPHLYACKVCNPHCQLWKRITPSVCYLKDSKYVAEWKKIY